MQEIINTSPYSLRAEVAREAVNYEGDLATFFSDLPTYDCQSGMISSLIYYRDTHAFYDTSYAEIEALRETLEDAFGELLRPKGDLKN